MPGVVATAMMGMMIGGSAVAGTAYYDIDQLLRQPHPFAAPPPVTRSAIPIQPTPPLRQPIQPVTRQAPASQPIPSETAQAPTPQANTDATESRGEGLISEIRIGGALHDTGPFSTNEEDGFDGTIEILFGSPDFLSFLWSPRPHIGGQIHSEDQTHQAYAGLTWEWTFWDGFFFDFSFGGAYHTGDTDGDSVDRKDLGCPFLFREAIDLGYRFADRHGISVYFSHISNANLCDENEGLESVGARYGYRF